MKTAVNEKVCACSCAFMRWITKHFPKPPLPFHPPKQQFYTLDTFQYSEPRSICPTRSWKTSSSSSQKHHMSCQALTCEASHSRLLLRCFAAVRFPLATRHLMSSDIMPIRKHTCLTSSFVLSSSSRRLRLGIAQKDVKLKVLLDMHDQQSETSE